MDEGITSELKIEEQAPRICWRAGSRGGAKRLAGGLGGRGHPVPAEGSRASETTGAAVGRCATATCPGEYLSGIGPLEVRQPRVDDRPASRGRRGPAVLQRDAATLHAQDAQSGGLDPVLYLKGTPRGTSARPWRRSWAKGARGCRPR